MAQKRLDNVEIIIQKDLASGEVRAAMNAVCWSPELETRFNVSLPLSGVEDIANNAVAALKEHMAGDGAHEVTEAEAEAE
tara:strand:+ start:80 stop:319 length:240 start_codon:yes stop_codon:yes gene_type:complete